MVHGCQCVSACGLARWPQGTLASSLNRRLCCVTHREGESHFLVSFARLRMSLHPSNVYFLLSSSLLCVIKASRHTSLFGVFIRSGQTTRQLAASALLACPFCPSPLEAPRVGHSALRFLCRSLSLSRLSVLWSPIIRNRLPLIALSPIGTCQWGPHLGCSFAIDGTVSTCFLVTVVAAAAFFCTSFGRRL